MNKSIHHVAQIFGTIVSMYSTPAAVFDTIQDGFYIKCFSIIPLLESQFSHSPSTSNELKGKKSTGVYINLLGSYFSCDSSNQFVLLQLIHARIP